MIEKAITKLDQAIQCILRCHLPSKITTHLVNTVIIPGIAYQLQLIPITKTHIDTINHTLQKIIKQKYQLPPNTSDHVLYDKQWGIGLINIQQCLEQTCLTNMNIWLAEPTIHRDSLMNLATTITQHKKLPMNIINKLTPLKSKYRNHIEFYTDSMANKSWKITSHQQMDPTNLYELLKDEDYHTHT